MPPMSRPVPDYSYLGRCAADLRTTATRRAGLDYCVALTGARLRDDCDRDVNQPDSVISWGDFQKRDLVS